MQRQTVQSFAFICFCSIRFIRKSCKKTRLTVSPQKPVEAKEWIHSHGRNNPFHGTGQLKAKIPPTVQRVCISATKCARCCMDPCGTGTESRSFGTMKTNPTELIPQVRLRRKEQSQKEWESYALCRVSQHFSQQPRHRYLHDSSGQA